MKYLKLFETYGDRDTFLVGDDLILPNVSVVEGKKDVIYKKKEKKLFPLTLVIPKINDEEYRLDPTPESIALCDYILNNGVFDKQTSYDVRFNSGDLYIQLEGKDIEEVTSMAFYCTDGQNISSSYVSLGVYDAGFWEWDIYLNTDSRYSKGTFIRYYDD